MAVPMGEITRALAGVQRRLCVKWGFVDMDVYEQEYRFCYFTRCPYEKTDMLKQPLPFRKHSELKSSHRRASVRWMRCARL